VIYDIVHSTEYRFHRPVSLGTHKLAFRPRDGHDMRVLATSLEVTPHEERVDLVHDVYGNSVALVQPAPLADRLVFTSRFTVEHLGSTAFQMPAASELAYLPPAYATAERLALQPFLLPSHEDPGYRVREWAQKYVGLAPAPGQPGSPRALIAAMAAGLREEFRYQVRNEEGTQTPQQTLELRSGSCRDFATLMIDALRHLGIAARFVSGYLYAPSSAGTGAAGSTHAWVQCYLSDCGWFPADPTNNLIGGTDLIRVAVARQASEVAPLQGTWFGDPNDFAGMSVDVQVTAREARTLVS
jgi:transglutaminase-like putative cysteine protease